MILPLFGLVLLDGLFLWAALAIAFVGLWVCLANDKPGWCTVDLIIVVLGLQFLTNVHPLQMIIANPFDIAFYIFGYFMIGTLWIFLKWVFHVYKIKNKYDDIKDAQLKELKTRYGGPQSSYTYFNQDGSLTDDGRDRFLSNCAYKIGERSLPMKISMYKSRLYMWWIVWPASIVDTVLFDLVKTVWNFVYGLMNGLLQRISDASITTP
jgi:hypothetical protein